MTTRQQAAERSLHNQINILPKRELVIVFAGLALPLLISFVDQNGIGVTLPTIARDLHAEDTISWAGTSSLIANTAFQMLYGRLSDIFGRKFVYLGAIMLLAIATLLCSFAENGTMFYVFRGIAGVGAGGLANLTMIIISDVCTLENKGYYQGIVGAFIGLGNVIGPFLAAAFVARGTWRAFFWTTAPIATLVGVISSYLIPSSQPKAGVKEGVKNIDYGGVILSSAGVTLLLIPISGGGAYFSWTSPLVISMLVLGSSSLLLFVLWEWKLAKLPMVPLDIFRSSAVSILLAQGFLFGSVYQSYLYYLPLYLQNARQYSVTQSAGAIAVLVGSQAVSSIISGYYISQLKKWKLFICSGFLLWTIGAGLVLLFDRKTSFLMIVTPLMIIGNGVGIVFQPTLTALQSHVARSRRAVIISNRNFFRSAGGATGLAISAAVLQAALKRNLPEGYQDLANTAYSLPKGQGPGFEAVLDAYMAASRAVFILQVPVIGACLLASVFLKDHGLEFPEERGEHEINEQLALKKDPNSIEKSEAVTPIAVPFNISDEEGQHDQAQPTPDLRV